MKIKVVDTPNDLIEFTAEVAPRKDEYIYYKDQGYKVSYICHYVNEEPDTGELGEVYAVAEVSPAQTFIEQQLKSHR
jgi:hypothetical protein